MDDIIITSEDIKQDVPLFSSVFEKKIIVPAYGMVKLDVASKNIKLSACNADIYVTSIIDTLSDNNTCSFCVDGEMFFRAVKNLTENIHITVDDKNVIVHDDRSTYSLPKFSGDDFIYEPEINSEPIEINGQKLSAAFETCLPFIGNDDLKPSLLGISVESKDGSLIFGSGNWKAMSIYYYDMPVETPINMLLPMTPVRSAILSEIAIDIVNLSNDDKWCKLSFFNKNIYILKLTAKTIPFYSNDKDMPWMATVNIKDLMQALRTTEGFYNSFKRINITIKNNNLTVESENNMSGGRVVSSCICDSNISTSFTIDAVELNKSLSRINEENVTFYMRDMDKQNLSVLIREDNRTFIFSVYM